MGVTTSALVAMVVLYADPIVLTGPIAEKDPERPPEPMQYGLGLRAELRSGHPQGGPRSPARTEGEVNPFALFRYPLEGGGITLAYEPRIFIVGSAVPPLPDGTPGRRVSYLHRARTTVEYQPTDRWKLFVNGRFAYGQFDFSPLTTVVSGAPAGTGNPSGGTTSPTPSTPSPTLPISGPGRPPTVNFLDVQELAGGTGFVHQFSRNLSWFLSGGYRQSGGTTPEAQTALPLQKGPLGATGLQWSVGPSDTWSVLTSASSSSFSTGAHASLIDLTTTWSHSWSRVLQTDITAGASGFHSSGVRKAGGEIQPTEDRVLPVAGVGFTHRVLRPAGDVINVLQLRVAPLPDQLNGSVYERFDAVLVSALPLAPKLWLELTSGMAIAVSGPETDIRLEGKLAYLFTPQLSLAAGGRTAWLRGTDPTAGLAFGWIGFVTFSAGLFGNIL